jgi:hypothetical protein
MERTEYLELCQKVSVLPDRICGIKDKVPVELLVVYNDITYYPEKYTLSFNKGQPIHTAILHDLYANAITEAKLERVKRYERKQEN